MLYILIFISNIPNFILIFYSYQDESNLHFFLPLFLSISFLSLAPRLLFWLTIIISPLALFEASYINRYKRVSDEHIYAIIKETNFLEAWSWLGISDLLILILSFLILISSIYFRKEKIIHFPLRWKLITLSSSIILFGLVNTIEIIDALEKTSSLESSPIKPDEVTGENLIGDSKSIVFRDYFPWGLPLRIQRYLDLQNGMDSAQAALEGFRFGAIQSDTRLDDREIFVLVIGETGRPDRWQLNGYGRATNPQLSRQTGLVSFTNTTTGWAWTRMSVPVMISRKPSNMNTSFFPEKSIVSAFKEAGFWTAWYSTQGALGFHESAVALSANEADETRYINPAGYRSPGSHDMELEPLLKKALARPERKKFIVLHTLGGHYNYAHRVPAEFDIFSPHLRDIKNTSLHNKNLKIELNNSYDNTIIYNDYFLNSIIQTLKLQVGVTSSLIYAADHGENIFDGECDKSGHGHNTEYDYRIAALWWNSQLFTDKYPGKVDAITAMRDQPWSTENIFDTLLDAAEIKIKNAPRENKSILVRDYKPSPRWVQSGLFFDQAEKNGICKILQQPTKKL